MVSRIYNRVADRYDEDWSGLYAGARKRCLRQIIEQRGELDRPDTLDLGVGTGNSLNELRQRLLLGSCMGLDTSERMLEHSASKLDGCARLIRSDAIDAARHLPPRSVDLLLCHFLLSFVDADILYRSAYRLLRPDGLFSLATSTRRSMRETYSGRFRRPARLLGVQRAVEGASTPADHADCLETLRSHGFGIVAEQLYRQPVSFESFTDVRNWALNSGWAASALDDRTGLRVAIGSAVFGLAKILLHPFYPVHAVCEFSIVLARKPPEPGCRERAATIRTISDEDTAAREPCGDRSNGRSESETGTASRPWARARLVE